MHFISALVTFGVIIIMDYIVIVLALAHVHPQNTGLAHRVVRE